MKSKDFYEKAKDFANDSKGAKTGHFVCEVPPTGKTHFGILDDKPGYGVYTKEQHGYKVALEKTEIKGDDNNVVLAERLIRGQNTDSTDSNGFNRKDSNVGN